MQPLNLPSYNFRTAERDGKRQIYDPVGQLYVGLTPQAWVRRIGMKRTDSSNPQSLRPSRDAIVGSAEKRSSGRGKGRFVAFDWG